MAETMYQNSLKLPISGLRGTFKDELGAEHEILIPHAYLEAQFEVYDPDPWGELLAPPSKSVYYLRIIPQPDGTAFTVFTKESKMET